MGPCLLLFLPYSRSPPAQKSCKIVVTIPLPPIPDPSSSRRRSVPLLRDAHRSPLAALRRAEYRYIIARLPDRSSGDAPGPESWCSVHNQYSGKRSIGGTNRSFHHRRLYPGTAARRLQFCTNSPTVRPNTSARSTAWHKRLSAAHRALLRERDQRELLVLGDDCWLGVWPRWRLKLLLGW